MKTMSKQQELLMEALLTLASGDATLVERAFDQVPPRVGTEAPDLLDIVYFILRESGRDELAAALKQRLEGPPDRPAARRAKSQQFAGA